MADLFITEDLYRPGTLHEEENRSEENYISVHIRFDLERYLLNITILTRPTLHGYDHGNENSKISTDPDDDQNIYIGRLRISAQRRMV